MTRRSARPEGPHPAAAPPAGAQSPVARVAGRRPASAQSPGADPAGTNAPGAQAAAEPSAVAPSAVAPSAVAPPAGPPPAGAKPPGAGAARAEPGAAKDPAGPAEGGPRRRRGRPAGPPSSANRERILATAREEFSARGYDKTSVRSIGKAAGVDPALVHHYFGTKEQVFAAAIESAIEPALSIQDAMNGAGPEGVGERMTRFMTGIWENPVTREPLLAIVRSALTNETAAAVFRGLISRRVLARVAGTLDVPDTEFRVQLAASHLVGIMMLRYIVKVEPMASADMEELVRQVSPALQRYLTAPDVHP